MIYQANSPEQQQDIGAQFGHAMRKPAVCFLTGDLGAGKTTFTQGVMRAFAYAEMVTSPTYNLVHQYPCDIGLVSHIDLYRLEDIEELENLAIIDVIEQSVLTFIEWPEKVQARLPKADYSINITVKGGGRCVEIIDNAELSV